MIDEARSIWAGLEFRRPMLLRNVEPLDEVQMRWVPGPGRVSIAWQVWHIAEVEDNWIRRLVLDEPQHLPFGVAMREAREDQYPPKATLLEYLRQVRALTRERLEVTTAADLSREVEDADFGRITVRDVWAGVVTSFAWHAGQVALTAKLLPNTPVTVQKFGYWKQWEQAGDIES